MSNTLTLYHGSNEAVKKPQIIQSDRSLDFGTGFYLTSSREQAERWAKLTTKRRKEGIATLSIFELNKNAFASLQIFQFEKADPDWLQFIAANRSGSQIKNTYDIIIGPVANDKAMPSISLYLMNFLNEQETLNRLLPQNLKDQYAFKTEKALNFLAFIEAIQHG